MQTQLDTRALVAAGAKLAPGAQEEMTVDLFIQVDESTPGLREVEIVERKGLGHPDTLCDAIAERVSVSLARPQPYPPWLTQLLEGPLRRSLLSGDRCLAASGLACGMHALEVGPGGGYVTEAAVERVGRDGRLVCLDVQLDMLRQVRARLGPRCPSLVCGSGSMLPFRAGVFDLVFLVGVLGEIPDQDGALGECCRTLRPGGTLAVTESLPDPDYVRAPVLDRRARHAGLVPGERHSSLTGYTQLLRRPTAGD